MEKATPAYLDKFHNPRSSDDCTTNSFVQVEVDHDNESRNKTDEDGYTDNN